MNLPEPGLIWLIGGSDCSALAGIQADLKTFAALGCYGMTAITALTAQNTLGVSAIHGVPPDMLKAQLSAVLDDIGVDAVKIGMLHAPDIVRTVAWALKHYKVQRVVLDPVMVATSGDRLIAQETVAVLVAELFPRATVITPNLDEAGWFVGHAIPDADALEGAGYADSAQRLRLKLNREVTPEQIRANLIWDLEQFDGFVGIPAIIDPVCCREADEQRQFLGPDLANSCRNFQQ